MKPLLWFFATAVAWGIGLGIFDSALGDEALWALPFFALGTFFLCRFLIVLGAYSPP